MAWAGPAVSGRQLENLFKSRPKTEPDRILAVGILSAYPSTHCGAATFAASLADALLAAVPRISVDVLRLLSTQLSPFDPQGDLPDPTPAIAVNGREAARELNKFDVVVIPHEHGMHDEEEAEEVLDLVDRLLVPVVLVVRTVLSAPTAHQRYVLEMLALSAEAVVTTSQSGQCKLLDDYRVEPQKLTFIPHDAPVPDAVARVADPARRPTVLAWGPLAPGKGIEWVIDALTAMSRLSPPLRCVVAGQTHPELSAEEADAYRELLARRADDRGVAHLIEFEPTLVNPERLRQLLREADVVVLPYNSHEQLTTPDVLTEPLAAGIPVVATRFRLAVELIGDGHGGILVPHEDPAAIAAALSRIIFEPGVVAAMSAHNATLSTHVNWSTIAGEYRRVFDSVARRPSSSR